MLDRLHIAGTMLGIVLVEVATLFPYAVMLYKAFMATIPREIDEAAVIDGCGTGRLFWNILFPLLKPITATIVILRSVIVYNDFSNPLYFLPGAKNSTVQLCIYLFQSMFTSDWNYMFAAIILVSIPPLILYLILNKRILEGMTMGSVKG
jgi:raffinose/stachyose/melibiose transport system permease protein